MNNQLIAVVHSGLVNRLLALLSCWRIADHLGRTFRVAWSPSDACHAEFGDLFGNPLEYKEKLPAKKTWIVRNSKTIKERSDGGTVKVDPNAPTVVVQSNAFLVSDGEPRGKTFWQFGPLEAHLTSYFARLQPHPLVAEKLQHFCRHHAWDGIPAVHVRWGTGDNPVHQERFQKYGLDPYREFIRHQLNLGIQQILLVTDSPDVRETLMGEFDGSLLLSPAGDFDKQSSSQAIQDALVDFLLLTRCREIVSMGSSSFAFTASIIGRRPFYSVLPSAEAKGYRFRRIQPCTFPGLTVRWEYEFSSDPRPA